jgi:hypothetical protein
MFIHQPKLIQHLKDELGSLIESLNEDKTPASPRTRTNFPDKEDILISPEMQTNFRYGVGDVAILGKHSRFDISNSV